VRIFSEKERSVADGAGGGGGKGDGSRRSGILALRGACAG